MHEEHDLADAVGLLLDAPVPEGTRLTLELSHVWGNAVLASRCFARDEGVRLGSESGDRWTFLGVDMGFVPRPVALGLRALPLWSDMERTFDADFVVPADLLPDERTFRLVEIEDGEQILVVPQGWEALFRLDGRTASADELLASGVATRSSGAMRVRVHPGLRFAVRVGQSVIVGGLAPVAARVALPRMASDDLPVLGMLGGGVLLAAAAALLTTVLGPPERTAGVTELDEEYVVMLMKVPPPPPPVTPDEGAPKAKGKEGKSGPKKADRKEERADRPTRKRELDRQVAERAGVLGAMGGELDEVLGSASLSAGLVSGVHGLIGTNGQGFDGLGARGSDLGGGGNAEGLGSIDGLGDGVHGAGPDWGPKREGTPIAEAREPIVLGTLNAAEIDEVVKRHMSQIRYCYQRELQRNPELGGKVVMKFTIAGDGSVSSTSPKVDTVGDGAVSTCLEGRFQRMQFPEPRGGGLVIVSYPLVFSH
ncbi:MAG: AgmX/PglI C-terminal domain-containing protein [Alphaproteobacteria bacterium]|nr:AgmX/PglI C-terminal domain-containing protein [Alphaproteobacteria bacterium]